MAMTLADAAALSNNQRLTGVVETLMVSTTVLDRLPFEPVTGNAYEYDQEATLPAAAFRAVNAGYTESTGTTAKATESLVILGGEYVVDRFLQQTRGNLVNLLDQQQRMKTKSINAKYSDAFINGDTAVDANSFNGLKKRLTGAQVVSAGVNGIPIVGNGTTDIDAFFDQLDNLIGLVPGCDVLYTNQQVLAKFRSASRRKTSNQTTVDSLGRTVDMYNGIPILDIGKKADQTQIIPQTETQGSSGVASSIYAAHFADSLEEPGVVGIENGGLQVDPPRQMEAKPSWLGRIEFYTGVALLGAQPAARLTGVLAN